MCVYLNEQSYWLWCVHAHAVGRGAGGEEYLCTSIEEQEANIKTQTFCAFVSFSNIMGPTQGGYVPNQGQRGLMSTAEEKVVHLFLMSRRGGTMAKEKEQDQETSVSPSVKWDTYPLKVF